MDKSGVKNEEVEVSKEREKGAWTEMRDEEPEQEANMERTQSSHLVEKEQMTRSERIGAWLVLDVERLSNKKLRNGWKRPEKAVNKEKAKCKE